MSELLSCNQAEGITHIVMDDGKANVMSCKMLEALSGAISQAETNGGVAVIQGRPGMFSGGFDLEVFRSGSKDEKVAMLKAGAELTEQLLACPIPVIAACTGHAIAMGAFLLLSCDYRLAADGKFKFAANEVAIGLTLPRFAITVCRQRLNPAALNRGLTLAYMFDPVAAQQGGWLDEVVPAEKLESRAIELATQCNKLHMESHRATKLRLRADMLAQLRADIEADCKDWSSRY